MTLIFHSRSVDQYEISVGGMIIGVLAKAAQAGQTVWRWHLHGISGRGTIVRASGAEPSLEMAQASANKSWNSWLALMQRAEFELAQKNQPSRGGRLLKLPAQTPHERIAPMLEEKPAAPSVKNPSKTSVRHPRDRRT